MPTTPTTPPSLTAAPTSPDRADRATFTARAIALDNWTKNNQVPEMGALGTNVFDNATVAYTAATTATTQASLATTKAGLTAADAVATAADRTASATSLAAVQALYLQFSDQYLGSLAADPTLDNHGHALTDGDFYINSVTGYLRAYTVAGGWVQGISTVSGVSSINTLTGAVTLKTINGLAITGTGDLAMATLASNTFTAAQIYSDQQTSRAMLIDCGLTVLDKGNSSTTTQTLDYTAGSVQKITATGNFTIATSNWPPTGNWGVIQLEAVNFGAFTVTWPAISWILPSGALTSSISTYLAAVTGRTAFQTSGLDKIKLESSDAGTTIYGRFA